MVGPGKGKAKPQLWLPPEGHERIRDFGSRLGWDDMFDTTFEIHDYPEGKPFKVAGFTLFARRLPHYTLLTFGLRVTNGSRTLAYSGDSGPTSGSPSSPATSTSSSARRRSSGASSTASRADTSRPKRPLRRSKNRARSVCC